MLTLSDDFYYQLSEQDKLLLKLLADSKFHVGIDLGAKLGVSKTSVSNAISRLKKAGLEIDSVKNSGYRLCFVPEFLQGDRIAKISGHEAYAFTTVDSTNNIVLKHPELDDGAVIAADFQNGGRGRCGRRFLSSCGTQVLFTYVARFDSLEKMQGLSVLVGISTARVLENMGVKNVQLKWPNDLYIGQWKLGGILIESLMKKDNIFVAIGIGINVSCHLKELLGDTIGQAYTSIEYASGFKLNRDELIGRIAAELTQDLVRFKESGLSSFMPEFEERALYLGSNVNLINDSKTLTGIYKGISERGALLLKIGRRTETILCGDMSLRPVKGIHELCGPLDAPKRPL